MIGLAARPGTAVEPTWSTPSASGPSAAPIQAARPRTAPARWGRRRPSAPPGRPHRQRLGPGPTAADGPPRRSSGLAMRSGHGGGMELGRQLGSGWRVTSSRPLGGMPQAASGPRSGHGSAPWRARPARPVRQVVQGCDRQFRELARAFEPHLLFTRQARFVHGVLARAVLAARVGPVVQPVRSCSGESRRVGRRLE